MREPLNQVIVRGHIVVRKSTSGLHYFTALFIQAQGSLPCVALRLRLFRTHKISVTAQNQTYSSMFVLRVMSCITRKTIHTLMASSLALESIGLHTLSPYAGEIKSNSYNHSNNNHIIIIIYSSPVFACECPHEELEGIRVSKLVHPKDRGLHLQSSTPGYNIGDILKLDCNVSDNDRARFNTKPEDFVVYPSNIRMCQSDCTWSGPPPVCLDPSKPMLRKIPESVISLRR